MPFNGDYYGENGLLKNLMGTPETGTGRPNDFMHPSAGEFYAGDGSVHNISELLRGGGEGIPGQQGPAGIPGPQGLQGIPGPQGNPGPAGPPSNINPRGMWSDIITDYEKNDVISYFDGLNTHSYIYVSDTPGDTAAPDASAAWVIFVMQGAQGIQGPEGIQGHIGPEGKQGIQGIPGNPGIPGINGNDGEPGTNGLIGTDGKSVYDLWLEAGHTGTLNDFLSWVKADAGGNGNIGEIFWWPLNTPPGDSLYCDGSEISRTDYAGLFTVIGTQYGAGNGTTTFKLPDLRGEFIRGYDPGNFRDPEGNRGIGMHQDATKHKHFGVNTSINPPDLYTGQLDNVITGSESTDKQIDRTTSGFRILGAKFTLSAESRNLYTSRPTNVNLLPCIRYKKGLPAPPVTGTATLQSIDGNLQWV